ncbi:MAG: Yip1 family protein [bacterium]
MRIVSIEKRLAQLARSRQTPARLFFGYALWIGLIPPVSAFFGTWRHGWPLGVAEPIAVSPPEALAIAALYALALIVGFLATALVIKWMAATYAEQADLRGCFAVVAVAGTPIMLGGVAHLYPSILLHIIILAPVFAFSAYLLFAAIPPLLRTNRDRGVLMGCAVLGFLVTAFLSLLGLSAILWVHGVGPDLGV